MSEMTCPKANECSKPDYPCKHRTKHSQRPACLVGDNHCPVCVPVPSKPNRGVIEHKSDWGSKKGLPKDWRGIVMKWWQKVIDWVTLYWIAWMIILLFPFWLPFKIIKWQRRWLKNG